MNGVMESLQALHGKMQMERASHLAAVGHLDSLIEGVEALLDSTPSEAAAPAKKRGRPKGSKNKASAKPGPKASAKKSKPGPKAGAKRGPKKVEAAAPKTKGSKFSGDTAIGETDLPPRVVKLCEANGITTIAELAEHYIPSLVEGVPRIGVGAIEGMKAVLSKAGLKSAAAPGDNGASAEA